MRISIWSAVVALVAAVGIGYLVGVGCEQVPVSIALEGAASVAVYEIPGTNFNDQDQDFDELHFDTDDNDTTPMLLIYADQGTDRATWYPLSPSDWYAYDGSLHIDANDSFYYRIVILYQLEA